MKMKQREMAIYHMQKQISRFYTTALRIVWGIVGVLILGTGFRVYLKDDFSYINGMLWYLIPALVLGLITFFLWVLRKREQNRTYQKMLSRWQQEEPETKRALKTFFF